MNNILQSDSENIESILQKVASQGTDYLKNINDRPTSSQFDSTEQLHLNQQGLGTMQTLEVFNQRFESTMVASSGSRFWGYVTGGSTPASLVGDWLASIYDQNTQATNGNGDISANIELETINLLLDLFELPKEFLGGFVTGATMSNFTCLAVARQWIGKNNKDNQGNNSPKDIAKEGIREEIAVLSATPHSSAIKAISLLGMGSTKIISIKTLEGNREAISISDLEKVIESLHGKPFILLSSGGTVNTVDFDDFEAITKLKTKYNFWWHIDAAFGGFAACSENTKHLVKGWENADSITIDCHKWLNVPYESAIFLVKKEYSILQTETFQNSNAPYLGNPFENFSYLNVLPENSRRLKALPAWFTLMAYGKEGYRDIVENCIDLANYFGQKITKSNDFELLAPIHLNNICFSLKQNKNEDNQEEFTLFLKKLNDTGKVFMTPTFYEGRKGIRASFVNWRTKKEDVDLVLEEMNQIILSF